MPITGLSDIRRFPRAGKIRLGEKRVNQKGNEYPAKVDYFVYPEEYAEVLTELFGEKCRELTIMFPVDDRDKIAPQFYKRYGAGSGLICKGDGETATFIDKETGEILEIDCPGRDCEHYASKACRHVMNLQFIIPQLVSEGVWQIDTSSFNSIVNFNSSWDYILALTGGRIAMVPLLLRVVAKEVQPEGKKVVVYVLELRLAERMSLSQVRALTAQTAAPVAALPALDEQTPPDDLYTKDVLEKSGASVESAGPAAPDIFDNSEDINIDSDGQSPANGAAALFDQLGYTEAKRTMLLKKYADDPDGLFSLLQLELEERNGNGSAPSSPSQARQSGAPAGGKASPKSPATPAVAGGSMF